MSSMRINHNIAALNSHRNLLHNDQKLGRTLEHLSSGLKINRAGDGPAALVISEQMRSQISGMRQAVANTEITVSMIQTAEAALNEGNRMLTQMRQLAIHAANEGANDSVMLAADQAEIVNSLDSLDRIANNTQFGTKYLLNGSNGSSGAAIGKGLRYVDATVNSKESPEGGYAVNIRQAATQSQIVGSTILTQEIIDKGEVMTLIQGGQSITYTTHKGDSMEQVRNNLQGSVDKVGLKLNVNFTEDGKLIITHRDFGSKQAFEVISTTAGVLSKAAELPEKVQTGKDVEGTIDGKLAIGDGQNLTGVAGTNVEGVKVYFSGAGTRPPGETVPIYNEEWNDVLADQDEGRVVVNQNSLKFQIGGNFGQTTKVRLQNVRSDTLAMNLLNESGFQSLRDIDLRSFQGAQDAMLLIDDAINQISSTRADLGAIQKNTLESNLVSLRIASENLVNAESVIRDADMAEEMADYTKNQIMMQSATSMLAQANQVSKNVLTLMNQA